MQQNRDHDTYLSVLEFDQEKSSLSIMQEKLPLRKNLDIGCKHYSLFKNGVLVVNCLKNHQKMDIIGESMGKNLSEEINSFGNSLPTQSLGAIILTSKAVEQGTTLSTVPQNLHDTMQQNRDHDTYLSVSGSDQEKSSLSIMQEKLPLRGNPDIGVQALQSVQEGSPRTKLPEKPSEDGYNWRKYGKKLLKNVERTHEALHHALPMDYITVSKLHNKLEGEVNQTDVRKLIDEMRKEGFVESQSNRRLGWRVIRSDLTEKNSVESRKTWTLMRGLNS
ncbi:hypothetical protein ACET3Z_005253 [Daucus carota]